MVNVSSEELIQLIEEQNQGIDLDFDQYLNLATTLIDSLNPNQLNYLKMLLQVKDTKDKDFQTDLGIEVYSYLLDKIDNLK